MKISICSLFAFSGGLVLALPLTMVAAAPSPSPSTFPTATPPPSVSPAASPGGSMFGNLDDRMRTLDQEMDNIFTNTFRNFGHWFDQSAFSSSVDLRDQKDRYVVRFYLPNGQDVSKVNAKIENGALHLTAGGEMKTKNGASTERYEQIIGLPGPVQADKMKMERKKNLVVVILPKPEGSNVTAASPSPVTTPAGSLGMTAPWDNSIINQMARMQGRMDQLMQEAFPHDVWSAASSSRLGSAVNLDDQQNKYIVHFYLPDRNLSDVNVSLKNSQLDLKAKAQEKNKTAGINAQSYAQYEQMITMPGPVKEKGMKVERKGETVTVTVPKA